MRLQAAVADRIERGRKLLAESPEHRGSTDLEVRVRQLPVGSAHYSTYERRLHRAALPTEPCQ